MRSLFYFLPLLASVMIASCASTHKPEKIDTELEVKGRTRDGKMGLNSDDELVIQEETQADDELRIQEAVNMKLQEDLNHTAHELKLCRKDLSDPRLGGSGAVASIPEVDNMNPVDKIKEQMGIAEDGEIKVVKKTYYKDRLASARRYEKSLRDMLKVISSHQEECETKMSQARVRAGLPGDRYKAEGYFTENGTWVESRKAEHSVSDAFEIQSMHKARAKQAE